MHPNHDKARFGSYYFSRPYNQGGKSYPQDFDIDSQKIDLFNLSPVLSNGSGYGQAKLMGVSKQPKRIRFKLYTGNGADIDRVLSDLAKALDVVEAQELVLPNTYPWFYWAIPSGTFTVQRHIDYATVAIEFISLDGYQWKPPETYRITSNQALNLPWTDNPNDLENLYAECGNASPAWSIKFDSTQGATDTAAGTPYYKKVGITVSPYSGYTSPFSTTRSRAVIVLQPSSGTSTWSPTINQATGVLSGIPFGAGLAPGSELFEFNEVTNYVSLHPGGSGTLTVWRRRY